MQIAESCWADGIYSGEQTKLCALVVIGVKNAERSVSWRAKTVYNTELARGLVEAEVPWDECSEWPDGATLSRDSQQPRVHKVMNDCLPESVQAKAKQALHSFAGRDEGRRRARQSTH